MKVINNFVWGKSQLTTHQKVTRTKCQSPKKKKILKENVFMFDPRLISTPREIFAKKLSGHMKFNDDLFSNFYADFICTTKRLVSNHTNNFLLSTRIINEGRDRLLKMSLSNYDAEKKVDFSSDWLKYDYSCATKSVKENLSTLERSFYASSKSCTSETYKENVIISKDEETYGLHFKNNGFELSNNSFTTLQNELGTLLSNRQNCEALAAIEFGNKHVRPETFRPNPCSLNLNKKSNSGCFAKNIGTDFCFTPPQQLEDICFVNETIDWKKNVFNKIAPSLRENVLFQDNNLEITPGEIFEKATHKPPETIQPLPVMLFKKKKYQYGSQFDEILENVKYDEIIPETKLFRREVQIDFELVWKELSLNKSQLP